MKTFIVVGTVIVRALIATCIALIGGGFIALAYVIIHFGGESPEAMVAFFTYVLFAFPLTIGTFGLVVIND